MSRSRIIPFTADVERGIILPKPKTFWITCPVIALGRKEFRGLDIDYNVIKLTAFAIEYNKNILANRYFTNELFGEYMQIMCRCCDDVTFTSDIDFLIQRGVKIC